jgi:hypothetical protein
MDKIKNELTKLEGCLLKKVTPSTLNSSIIELVIENSNKEEVLIMIYCSWRLSQKSKILTGWNDPYYSNESNYFKQITSLVGHAVIVAQISDLFDITLLLNDKKLTVFCDLFSTETEEEYENWDLCIPDRNICYSSLSSNELKIVPYS